MKKKDRKARQRKAATDAKKRAKRAAKAKKAAKRSTTHRRDDVSSLAWDARADDLPPRPPMERILAMARGPRRGSDPLEEAQELMYEAWESPPGRALALAREAHEISPDCADAYNLLAERAETLEDRTSLFTEAVSAGERALGDAVFEEDVGHFWGLLETRPYMRARAGLATCLWGGGLRKEAVQHYEDMLRLNPGDNQGIRYVLMGCLLEMGDGARAEDLYARYEEDGMAAWKYARTLLDFGRGGDVARTRTSLEAALEANAFVPAYLLGRKQLPRTLPSYQALGEESEAIHYAIGHGPAWRKTPGALAWLAAAVP